MSLDQHEAGRIAYCDQLFAHHEIQANLNLRKCTGMLIEHFDLTLREIERVITVIALYYASNKEPGDAALVSVLAVLKVKHPAIFTAVCDDSISGKEFYMQTAIDRIKDTSDFSAEWIRDSIDFYLLTAAEFDAAVKDGRFKQRQGHFSSFRKAWLRRACVRLNRFSLSPK